MTFISPGYPIKTVSDNNNGVSHGINSKTFDIIFMATPSDAWKTSDGQVVFQEPVTEERKQIKV